MAPTCLIVGLLLLLADLAPFSAANEAPQITLAPRDHKVMREGLVSFFCDASGNPVPDIHWYKNGQRVTSNIRRYLTIDIAHTSHTSILRIMSVLDTDAATFTCMADNGVAPAVNASATLHVYAHVPNGMPRITENPVVKAVEKGRNVVMLCSAEGNPEPTITWVKDFKLINMSDPRFTLLSTGLLQILHTTESDQGRYECVAENEVGIMYSYGANLYVRVRRVPPHFSIPPESVEVMPGGAVNLTCVAVGAPMPYVKWRLGTEELTPEYSIPLGRNVLMLTNVMASANYTCVASSDLGSISAIAGVKVKGPSAPLDVKGQALDSCKVEITWLPPREQNGLLRGYKVRYAEADSGTSLQDAAFVTVEADQRSTVLKDLKEWTQYTVWVAAFDQEIEGPSSDAVTVQTDEGAFSSWCRTALRNPSFIRRFHQKYPEFGNAPDLLEALSAQTLQSDPSHDHHFDLPDTTGLIQDDITANLE